MTLRQLLKHPAVRAVIVGRCIDGDDWRDTDDGLVKDREAGHAHVTGKHAGCICIRSPREVLQSNSRQVSHLALHELAHLISKSGHDDKWRAVMKDLGEVIPNRYRKRTR